MNWKSNVRPSISYLGIGFMVAVFLVIALYAHHVFSTFDAGFSSTQAQAASLSQ